jgi:hypothetical protein
VTLAKLNAELAGLGGKFTDSIEELALRNEELADRNEEFVDSFEDFFDSIEECVSLAARSSN